MDMDTGRPVALIESDAMTAHRTAATTTQAVGELLIGDELAAGVIGTGDLVREHVRYVAQSGRFTVITVGARDPTAEATAVAAWTAEGVAGTSLGWWRRTSNRSDASATC